MGGVQQLAPTGRVVRETVSFRGHAMVRALHPRTIEVTTDEDLTPRGDCIIGVAADKGCGGLGEPLKAAIRNQAARVRVAVHVEGLRFVVSARGHPRLDLSDPHEIVIRKSDFTSERTLAVGADSAAVDIPRPMVRLLTNPAASGRLEIEVT